MKIRPFYLILIVIVGAAIFALVTRKDNDTPTASPTTNAAGLQETDAPWQPEKSKLAERLAGLQLPSDGTALHQHVLLQVFIDGKEVPMPANIGIIPGSVESSLHTHDVSGVIHMEASKPYTFKLGQLFDVWGVVFKDAQIGSYKNTADKIVSVYVNGKKIDNPRDYTFEEKDKIVISYGAIGTAPTTVDKEFPKDL